MSTSTKTLASTDRRSLRTIGTQVALIAAAATFVFVLFASYGVDLSPGLF